MINPKELRIGNLVTYNQEDNLPVAIHAILQDELDTGYRKLLSIDKIFPIPITPEWLEKLGIGNREFLQYVIHKREDGYLIYQGHGCFYVNVKYVHQLQNLYFALTGKELPINQS